MKVGIIYGNPNTLTPKIVERIKQVYGATSVIPSFKCTKEEFVALQTLPDSSNVLAFTDIELDDVKECRKLFECSELLDFIQSAANIRKEHGEVFLA